MQNNYNREQFLEKPLPSAPESERIIIGAILLDNLLVYDAMALLVPNDFYSPLNRRIYQSMVQLADQADRNNEPLKIEPVLIGELLKGDGTLASIGGVATITNLTYGLPHFSDIKKYCLLVKSKAKLRERVKVCGQIVNAVLSEEDEDEKTLAATAEQFAEHAETVSAATNSQVADTKQSVAEWRNKTQQWKAGKNSAIPSCFPKMNRFLNENGFVLGDLWVDAGRPSDGKTVLGLQKTWNVARHYAPSLFLTYEMSKDELIQRVLCGIARVPNYRINKHLFTSVKPRDIQMVRKLDEAAALVEKFPMYICEVNTLTEGLAAAQEYATRHGVLYVYWDYLQEIENDLFDTRNMTRDQELGKMLSAIKKQGRRVNRRRGKYHNSVAVQLKKSADGKQAPTLADLRESGRIEQVADGIGAAFGEKPTTEVIMREMQYICLKQRKGRVGWKLPFWLHGDWQMFYDEQMRDDDLDNIRRGNEIFDDEDEPADF